MRLTNTTQDSGDVVTRKLPKTVAADVRRLRLLRRCAGSKQSEPPHLGYHDLVAAPPRCGPSRNSSLVSGAYWRPGAANRKGCSFRLDRMWPGRVRTQWRCDWSPTQPNLWRLRRERRSLGCVVCPLRRPSSQVRFVRSPQEPRLLPRIRIRSSCHTIA
jgi:hypothetical protein